MANAIAPFPQPDPSPASRTARTSRAVRYELDNVPDEALHAEVKALAGRHNVLTAELLAHLAEVDARGIYRERACSSLYTYCIYELRLSEDEAQRRTRAARTARTFPILFQMLAEGAIHLTGLLLLAPCLTKENHIELLALARFRTKREIEHLVAEVAPRPDVPARIEPLGPRPARTASSWQAYVASLRGPVRELAPGIGAGQAPPVYVEDGTLAVRAVADGSVGLPSDDAVAASSSAPARVDAPASVAAPVALDALRYRVEFTASERYVELLEEARNLLQHQVPDRDVARVHELAMAAFVEQLRKRRQAATGRLRQTSKQPAPALVAAAESERAALARVATTSERPAPARVNGNRHVPAAVRREVWRRDGGSCTFVDSSGRRCPERAGLEVHHEHAFALGGATTTENLRLMCRAHNALFAERDFGRAHVERMKHARR